MKKANFFYYLIDKIIQLSANDVIQIEYVLLK